MKSKKGPTKSRKMIRKENRKAKKARKHEYFVSKKKKQNIPNMGRSKENSSKFVDLGETVTIRNRKGRKTQTDILPPSKIANNKKAKLHASMHDEIEKDLRKFQSDEIKLRSQMKKNRLKQLREDNEKEDDDIRRLEKRLKINKRSDKSVANFFASDGLDYLLEVCDRKKLQATTEATKHFNDDSDFEEDLAAVTGTSLPQKKKHNKESESDAPKEFGSKKGGTEIMKNLNDSTAEDSAGENDDDSMESEHSDLEDSSGEDNNIDDESNICSSDESNHEVHEALHVEKCLNKTNKIGKVTEKVNVKKPAVVNKKVCDPLIDKKAEKARLKKGIDSSDNSSKLKTVISDDDSDVDISDDSFDDEEEGDNASDVASDNGEGSDGQNEEKKNNLWEDIYGRTRDKEGNVVNSYKPPHLRNQESENIQSEKFSRLKKQLKGLLNRLAENNMVSISSQIEALYMANSRNDMNETLWSLLRESLVSDVSTPERLVAEHAMLLAVLGANVGGEVSAHILQHAVMEWHNMWASKPAVEDKHTNNILLLLSYMFYFKIFHSTLLYDILQLLLDKLEEKEVELILLVLRSVGFTLRKEDALRLKDFVLRVQKLANDTTSASQGSRARFLLDTVLAIKNNNMTKIPNYNPEYVERLKKGLKTCIRKGNYNAELKVTLDDLLKAEERGRWWVVGSAWTGVLPGEKNNVEDKEEQKPVSVEGFSNKLLELAKKQRMNTDARRAVFCSLMSSEDYIDAFEKLMKLGLKGPAERELMNVLLHCLLVEKEFNPYYAYVAKRFCSYNRRFQIMLQFAVWDKVRELQSLPRSHIIHLAKFLTYIVLEKSLPISVLKIIEFAELDKPSVKFMRQVLLGILLADDEESAVAVFSRISKSASLKLFREGLRLFLHHFVLKNSKSTAGTDLILLNERVRLADAALSAGDRSSSNYLSNY